MLPRLAQLVRVMPINMNQPNVSESALKDDCACRFQPLIRAKAGVAVSPKLLDSSLDFWRCLPESVPWGNLAHTVFN